MPTLAERTYKLGFPCCLCLSGFPLQLSCCISFCLALPFTLLFVQCACAQRTCVLIRCLSFLQGKGCQMSTVVACLGHTLCSSCQVLKLALFLMQHACAECTCAFGQSFCLLQNITFWHVARCLHACGYPECGDCCLRLPLFWQMCKAHSPKLF